MKMMVKLGIAAAAIYVLFYIGYNSIGALWNPSLIQKNNEALLDRIREQQFDEAAKLFAGDTMDEDWPTEMKKLQDEAALKLVGYDNVKAEYDDGSYNTGHADLIFDINGQQVSTQAILTFREWGKPGQVCAITPPDATPAIKSAIQQWNDRLCGGGSF
ncbi:hypothetical protein ACX1C1_16725 [Paenibacillus sp. strain BS8-2]